jgi:HEAT repeat protein
VLTEADPWTSDGLAQLSHEQLASILRLLNHADREVVDRANAALEEVAERHGALAAYFANQHRQLLIELMLDARPAFPGSLPALLAYANPRPYEVGSKVVAAMADEAFSVRVAGVRALATLGIPMPEAATALTEILLTDDYVGSSERAAAQVGEPLTAELTRAMAVREVAATPQVLRIFARAGVSDLLPVSYWEELLTDSDPRRSVVALRVLLRAGDSEETLVEHVRVRLRRYVDSKDDPRSMNRYWMDGVVDLALTLRGRAACLEHDLRAAAIPPAGRDGHAAARIAAPAVIALCLVTGDVAAGMPIVVDALPRSGRPGAPEHLAIARIGRPAVPYLLAALTDDRGDVASAAAGVLGYVAPATTEIAEALVSAVGRKWGQTVQAALARMGQTATPALVSALADTRPLIRSRAAETLGMMNDRAPNVAGEVAAGLHACLYDDVEGVRVAAMLALCNLGAQASDLVAPMLASDDLKTRRSGIRLLRALTDASAAYPTDLLLASLDDSAGVVRAEAAHALGDVRPPIVRAVPRLREMLDDAAPLARAYAARALWYTGVPAEGMVEPLVKAMADGDALVRRTAAGALGTIPARGSERIQVWVGLFNDASDGNPKGATGYELGRLVAVAAWELSRIGEEASSAVPALASYALRHDVNTVGRYAAIDSLGRFGRHAASSIPTLVYLATGWPREQGHDLFIRAARALAEIGTREAVEALADLVVQGLPGGGDYLGRPEDIARIASPILEERLRYDDVTVRRNAAMALGSLGRWATQARGTLRQTAFGDPDVAVRAAALAAAQRIDEAVERRRRVD